MASGTIRPKNIDIIIIISPSGDIFPLIPVVSPTFANAECTSKKVLINNPTELALFEIVCIIINNKLNDLK